MTYHRESELTEKDQISLLQNKVGSLSSNVHLEYKHVAKIERLVKWLCSGLILTLVLLVYLIILHVS